MLLLAKCEFGMLQVKRACAGWPCFLSSLEVDTVDEGGDYPPHAPHSAGLGAAQRHMHVVE